MGCGVFATKFGKDATVGKRVCLCSLIRRPGGPGHRLLPADRDRFTFWSPGGELSSHLTAGDVFSFSRDCRGRTACGGNRAEPRIMSIPTSGANSPDPAQDSQASDQKAARVTRAAFDIGPAREAMNGQR